MRLQLICILLLASLTGCGQSSDAQDEKMSDAWEKSRGNSGALSCLQVGQTSINEVGIASTKIKCTFNVSLKSGSVYKITNGSLFIINESSEQTTSEDSRYLDFEVGVVDAKAGDEYDIEVLSEAGLQTKDKVVQFALWNEDLKEWEGTSNNLNIVIPVDSEKVNRQREEENQAAAEEFSAKWFQEGFSEIMNRDPETLYRFGISKAFGATGDPIASKMNAFCRSFTVFELEPGGTSDLNDEEKLMARESWNEGCVSAGMSLRLP